MSWIRYETGGHPAVGRLEGERIFPTAAKSILDPERETTATGAEIGLADVRQLPAVASVPSFRDFMSYEQHVVTLRRARGLEVPPVWFEQPVFYFSNPAALQGPTDPVPRPPGCREFDFEIEVGAILNADGRDIPVDEAADYIAGYVLLCDWSARDLQLREYGAGLGPAKAKDGATSLGSIMMSPSDFNRALSEGTLTVSASVNGRSQMQTTVPAPYWSFPQMVSYASRGAQVRGGDLIGSGTIGGGCLWELRAAGVAAEHPWLEPGDVVEIEAGPLGSIRAQVEDSAPPLPLGVPDGGART